MPFKFTGNRDLKLGHQEAPAAHHPRGHGAHSGNHRHRRGACGGPGGGDPGASIHEAGSCAAVPRLRAPARRLALPRVLALPLWSREPRDEKPGLSL